MEQIQKVYNNYDDMFMDFEYDYVNDIIKFKDSINNSFNCVR